jgi:hypothetical protein
MYAGDGSPITVSVSCAASSWTPGTFTLKLKASQGEGNCQSNAEADATITVSAKPTVTLAGQTEASVCPSDSETVFEYTLSPPDATISLNPTDGVACEQGELQRCFGHLVSCWLLDCAGCLPLASRAADVRM